MNAEENASAAQSIYFPPATESSHSMGIKGREAGHARDTNIRE